MTQSYQNSNRDLAYETALRFHSEFGFNVFPLKAGDKKPLLPSWKPWQTERVREEQIEAWHEKFPRCNWAFVCGPISDLVVVDCDDMKHAAWCREHLPATPLHVTTGKGFHAYYRYPADNETWLNALNLRSQGLAIDIRRGGQYVVAPGSVHPNGAIYKDHIDGPWEDTPVFQLLETGTALDVDLDYTAIWGTIPQGGRNNALTRIAGILVSRGYEEQQLRMELAAINKACCQPPLPFWEVGRIASSVWKAERRKRSKATPLPENVSDFSDIEIDNADPLADTPVPEIIMRPDGLLGQIADYITAGAVRTHPIFSFAGALSCLATIVGMKVQSPTGKTTNLYVVCIGGSSSGKDAPKSGIKRIFEEVAPGLYGGSDVASDVAILNYLSTNGNNRANLTLDELGMFLKSTKQPNSARAGVVKLLTELYSCTTNYVKLYADQEKNRRLDWHCLNLLGLSVPEEFYGALQSGEATNGFLARLLVFDASSATPTERNFNLRTDIPKELQDHLIDLTEKLAPIVNLPKPNGNGQTELFPLPNPLTLTPTREAQAFFLAKVKEWDDRQLDYDRQAKSAAASLAGRISEQTLQLALVFAVSRAGLSISLQPDITLQDMQRAWDVAEFCLTQTITRVESSIAENEFDALIKNIKKAIRCYVRREASKGGNASKPGATKAAILKTIPAVPLDLFDKAIAHMVAANELRIDPAWRSSPNSRRVLELYCLTLEKEDGNGQ